jgi:hypothetical protein
MIYKVLVVGVGNMGSSILWAMYNTKVNRYYNQPCLQFAEIDLIPRLKILLHIE